MSIVCIMFCGFDHDCNYRLWLFNDLQKTSSNHTCWGYYKCYLLNGKNDPVQKYKMTTIVKRCCRPQLTPRKKRLTWHQLLTSLTRHTSRYYFVPVEARRFVPPLLYANLLHCSTRLACTSCRIFKKKKTPIKMRKSYEIC